MAELYQLVRVLPGYELTTPNTLGIPAKAVCQEVARDHGDWDCFLTIGGWGGTASSTKTTGAHMMEELMRLGVPREKIILPLEDLDGFAQIMPPRDTGEERKLLKMILELSEFQVASVVSMVVEQWMPRTMFIDEKLGIKHGYLPVYCKVPFVQRLREPIAYRYAKRWNDPFGICPGFMGDRFKKNRKKRTMIKSSGLTPLTPD